MSVPTKFWIRDSGSIWEAQVKGHMSKEKVVSVSLAGLEVWEERVPS